jgi:hypothetical protein
MPKLVDTLHRAGKVTGPAIGFMGAQGPKPKAAAIIVQVAATSDAIDAAVKAGADVLVLEADDTPDAAKAAGVSWGYDLRGKETITSAELKMLHEHGADFVLLPQNVSMHALNEPIEHLERALIVAPPQKDDPFLLAFRAFNLLEMEVAVLDLQLTARDLATISAESFARLRMLNDTLRFPVIVTVRDLPVKEDVFTLAKLGAQGIWLSKATPETIKQLRESLESVPREKETVTPSASGR